MGIVLYQMQNLFLFVWTSLINASRSISGCKKSLFPLIYSSIWLNRATSSISLSVPWTVISGFSDWAARSEDKRATLFFVWDNSVSQDIKLFICWAIALFLRNVMRKPRTNHAMKPIAKNKIPPMEVIMILFSRILDCCLMIVWSFSFVS